MPITEDKTFTAQFEEIADNTVHLYIFVGNTAHEVLLEYYLLENLTGAEILYLENNGNWSRLFHQAEYSYEL